eukprot:TRINITY_DN5277_c0_g2_i1.p1 TRINITY_DN5277_c0_g2~~TRINITY_DN5277_c0_g2_i1.p1  ORF type:complete len:371 (-),score=128.23 TRINITY_DN5277_c0_g2_i1:274-1386(-)
MAQLELEEQIGALGEEIRVLKQALSAQLPSAEVNKHEGVLAKVAELRTLKAQLGSGSALTEEAFRAKQKAEKDSAKEKHDALAKSQAAELKRAQKEAPIPLVQRKIFHMFEHRGSGDKFCYAPPPRLNAAQTGFGAGEVPNPAVYITEKWDGTTLQATNTHIFKRLDLWGKRKNGADPSQRYELRLIAWRGAETNAEWCGLDFIAADPHIAEAVGPYLQLFEKLEDGLCVYFEAVHSKINATFRHLEGFAGIRVFDSSRGDKFLPFEETIELAETIGMPLVAWQQVAELTAAELWRQLCEASQQQYSGVPAALEGFVVREAGAEGWRIGKARVENLPPEEERGLTERTVEKQAALELTCERQEDSGSSKL